MDKQSILCSLGDPTGIGPEVFQKAAQEFLEEEKSVKLHVFGPASSIDLKGTEDRIEISSIESSATFKPGQPSEVSGRQALLDLKRMVQTALTTSASAIVTGPVDKYICSMSKPNFRGQTEYISELTHLNKTATMMLAGPELRVSLVTTHLALRDVATAITEEKILLCIERSFHFLGQFIDNPKIAILGLNPHASDRGLLGTEEKEVIEPAIKKAQKDFPEAVIEGPFSADSFFAKPLRHDAVIAMYHDQGLIPLKQRHQEEALNLSLGLPFLRISVDHGTAFDIAGKDKASHKSYLEALRLAWKLQKKSSQNGSSQKISAF